MASDEAVERTDGSDVAQGAGSGAAREAGLRRREAVQARRALLTDSGLFDPGWYLAHAPAALLSDLDPLDHYLAYGVRDGISPGPLFDACEYRRHAWHLEAVDDPLSHFLDHGALEERVAHSLPSPAAIAEARGRPIAPFALLGVVSGRSRVAVMVHAFHPELFDEICSALRFLPAPFTLLVTVASAEDEAAVHESVSRNALDTTLVVRVAENRGRNFGAMLCCFREAIRAHDLLLHLHTKRSLHHPGGMDGWRRSLLCALLPARSVVSGLIDAFERDPALGVLSPAPPAAVRPWAYGWLRNRDAACDLFGRLGSALGTADEAFDYPAGGMFWARTEAIGALLDHPWQANDFPEESGQTDGTLAHAIERSIILLARARGYGFRELDAANGLVRLGWGSRSRALYPEYDRNGLDRELLHAGVASFDLFDTLLTRISLSPDAVHRFLAHAVKRRFPAATGYVALRTAAEQAARLDRAEGEVDLAEIHARFSVDAGPGWSEAAIRFVQEGEVALDMRTLRPRTAVVQALRSAHRAGRRTILVSDSYLTRPLFDAMLERFDLANAVDEIYLSAERRARKDRGDLWDLVKRREPVGLFHVGDNAQSDIQATGDRGLRHMHLLSPASMFREHGLLPESCHGDLGADILLGPLAEQLFNAPWPATSLGAPIVLHDAAEAGALLLGPLLFSFVAWLIRHPTLPHLGTVFFVSREGYFLKRMYDAVVEESGLEGLPPSRYFHCSRRAALGALQGGGVDTDPVLQGAGFARSLQDFLQARIGFEADPSLELRHVPIRQPRDNDLVRAMMALMHEPIERHGREMADSLRAYAAANNMGEGPDGFVDVGYSGTMQTALQRVLGNRLVGLYMGVSHAAAQVRDGSGFAFGAFADGDVSDFTGGYGLMLEAFLTAPHGQVIGWDASQTPPEPVFRHDGHSQTVFDTLERFYEGAERYARDLLRCWGPDVLHLPFPAEAATAMLAAIRNGRLLLDRSLAAALSVEDDFCGNGELRVFG